MSKRVAVALKYFLFFTLVFIVSYFLCRPIKSNAAYTQTITLVNTFTLNEVADTLRIQWVPYPYGNINEGDTGGEVGGGEIGGEEGGEEEVVESP